MSGKAINKKELLDNAILDNLADRQWASVLHELPDPDPILRKANIDQDVYKEILGDPHVMGEVRKMYASLISFKHEIKAGDDSPQAQDAKELCQQLFDRSPHKSMRWPDLFWSMGRAPLTGRRVHHVSWKKPSKYLIPDQVFDISSSSYAFDQDGELLIRTTDSPQGEPAKPHRWLVTRHMPDAENPYGVAILSSCFWPWMFKNGGIKFFAKFCEKFGVPWPVGKYPRNAQESDITSLVTRLQLMLEDAVAAIPDDSNVELIQANSSGTAPQENMINLMNREMSKALTSQSLATEIIKGGSRAAAETGDKRTDVNNKADRALIADTVNQLFEYITDVNFGENVASPKFVYIDKKQLDTKDVEWLEKAASILPISRSDAYKRLDLSEPKDGDEVIFTGGKDTPETSKDIPEFSAEFSTGDNEWKAEDTVLDEWLDQIKTAIEKGDSLEEALAAIIALVPELDIDVLSPIVSNELELEYGKGMLETKNTNSN